jgi:hydrophobic/amphiphilic exporter-1 (mainly G- bacteria), HAE1 family
VLGVLGLAILFAYLFLVALYESWNIPISALLSVSVAVLGSRHAVGTPVFGGMIAAFFLGIFIVPLLYITAEQLRNGGTGGEA